MLVLSLFPGIDLLGRGFEAEGYCVVRGPDLIFGGDIRAFTPPAGRFDGVIGGPPCQDFSSLRRGLPTGNGLAMLAEFCRCVEAARPDWFVMENVPGVPNITPAHYAVQRFDLRASECGLSQQRLRHFQFGSASGEVLLLNRDERQTVTQPAALASAGTQQQRRGWPEFCQAQGLPPDFDLPSFTLAARYQAVGNGVPIPMGRFIARAIRDSRYPSDLVRLCICGCGRSISGKQLAALPACRKRMERRRRDQALAAVTRRDTANDGGSQERRDMARSVGRCTA
jgi:DNA (cytosine-5)-methyltransferase 1